ncbi:hypothetical protein KKY_156 [Pelagibacterium halotolerans B2]|uniref:Uncharacterized protein n=1 Tax=Pelagibacterium halotolerans (strain DSM 22347 / JCM 15775 / CGMCC 1.7692 / B2) TaxID=1082931 RepID=G4R749_PELHB|nr:hypothetical protein KKY_156 [Pelagibacterium halotolerans B2]
MKKRAMMLAALQTMANANPVRRTRRFNPDVAAQASTGKVVHSTSPSSPYICGTTKTDNG